MNKVSIIVPIYNAEKYLSKCVESLISQTLIELEILLVNDGSKDESLEICERYAKIDKRIKVINQDNQGVAVARNKGLEVCTGEYIGFVDPDDWVEPEMYESMYNHLTASDCAMCLCNYYKDSKKNSNIKRFKFKETILDRQGIKEKLISPMIGIDDLMPKYVYIMGSVWRCVCKRSFLQEHNIKFMSGITIMEDLVFCVQALLKCDQVCIDHGVYYHYVQNPKSILHTHNKKMWQDQVKVHDLLEELVQDAELEEEMRNRLDMRYIGMAFSAMRNEAHLDNKEQVRQRFEMIKQICADEKLRSTLERVKPIQKPILLDKEMRFFKNNEEESLFEDEDELKPEKEIEKSFSIIKFK